MIDGTILNTHQQTFDNRLGHRAHLPVTVKGHYSGTPGTSFNYAYYFCYCVGHSRKQTPGLMSLADSSRRGYMWLSISQISTCHGGWGWGDGPRCVSLNLSVARLVFPLLLPVCWSLRPQRLLSQLSAYALILGVIFRMCRNKIPMEDEANVFSCFKTF